MTKKTIIVEDDFDESTLFGHEAVLQKPVGNPLADFFRMPGLHVSLPTRGAFMPPELYEETLAGEVPVFPMKAADEILLRSPDALMSGYALEQLIKSCVPAIKAPRLISTPDLDVLLLAIRAATYGETMEVTVNCPKCGAENIFDCHLPSLMGNMTFIPPVNEVRLAENVIVNVRPFNMGSATRTALKSFEEARRLQSVGNDIEDENERDEVRRVAMNESFEKMSLLNLDGITDCIISVVVPSGPVTEREYIRSFIANTSQPWVKLIENKLVELNNMGIDKKVDATCVSCKHEWSPEVEFDPTSFFGQGS
jgi:hypothetical protein